MAKSILTENNPNRQQAIALRKRGYTYSQIGDELGITERAAKRLAMSAKKLEAERAAARERKAKITGICVICGGKTKYNGRPGYSGASHMCGSCARTNQRLWTRELIIDAIRRWAKMHGKPPKAMEWLRSDAVNGFPAASTVYGRGGAPFSTWNDAIRAAGFDPRKFTKIDYAKLLDQIDEGMTVIEMAEAQGCSIAGVYRALDMLGVKPK